MTDFSIIRNDYLIRKIEKVMNKKEIQLYDFNYEVVWLYFFVQKTKKFMPTL